MEVTGDFDVSSFTGMMGQNPDDGCKGKRREKNQGANTQNSEAILL